MKVDNDSFFEGQLWGIKVIGCAELPPTAILRECNRLPAIICVGIPSCAACNETLASHLGSECFMSLALCCWLWRPLSDWVFTRGSQSLLSTCQLGPKSLLWWWCPLLPHLGHHNTWMTAPPPPWARKQFARVCDGLGLRSIEPAVFDIAIWKSMPSES